MTINFKSSYNYIGYSFVCTNNQIFAELERKLCEKFPEIKEQSIYFLFSGKKIKSYETLEEIGIKDNDTILINNYETSSEK